MLLVGWLLVLAGGQGQEQGLACGEGPDSAFLYPTVQSPGTVRGHKAAREGLGQKTSLMVILYSYCSHVSSNRNVEIVKEIWFGRNTKF